MNKGMFIGIIIAIIVILLVLYFAFGSKSAVAPTESTAPTATEPVGTETKAEVAGKTWTTPSGLTITDVKVGDGPIEAKAHDVIIAHYTGTLTNGTKFDSSYDHPGQEPLKLPIGEGRVIKGWDEGILGMRKGGKRHLVIPAALAYGAQSPSPLIPANSDLIFDIEMVDVWQALVNQPPR